ncbi:AhpD family alkylhydroperoxidase [Kribbella amoyensis]|uniref:AhpD family alkylhydroperoxidase n=1 Tax=Kribbella amoyensis TaxID=996641 RepID=A0A561BQ36_9ACTN|nr:carboxymuconolactone decarboxylase family protein [Kribbella amoyensis]TWD80981.1 AhpD family alkylhydroperoxidase [Kribbella amoyensis]
MQLRMKNPAFLLPDGMQGIQYLLKASNSAGVPGTTLELIGLRASQLNGCTACAQSHAEQARRAGETDQRLAVVATWRHAPYFTPAERAALALTEDLTRLADRNDEAVPDALWAEVSEYYDEPQRAAIILLIGTVNLFNRLNVTVREQADQPSWQG